MASRRSLPRPHSVATPNPETTVFFGIGGALGASGWRTPFWLYLVALLLVLPMARFLWEPEPPAGRAAATGRSLPPLPWRLLLPPLLVTLLGAVTFYALVVELSIVLDDVGVESTATIGGISALMTLSAAIGSGSFGRFSGSSPKVLLPVEFALVGLGLLIVSTNSTVPLITLGAVITGFGNGLLLPTLLVWAINRLSFHERGRGTGWWTGMLFMGQFLTPLILAAVGAGVGGLQPALGILGAAALAMAVLVVLTLRGATQPLNVTHD